MRHHSGTGFIVLAPVAVAALLAGGAFAQTPVSSEEFVGPFSSWTNVKTTYGATGNGTTDDTAAIQKALSDLAINGHSPVLYFPAGTYRITKTLNLAHANGVSLIGEDPATTRIVWGGAGGMPMIFVNSVALSKFSRLTFDGRDSAQTAVDQSWDGSNVYFDDGNEYSDDTFENVGYGIRGGRSGFGFADTSVLRSHFINNTVAGITVENFNALDLWVWYSTFQNCYEGVSGLLPDGSGAGAYHVFNSIFQNSTYADFVIGNSQDFSIRNNYSSGSGYFLMAGGTNNPVPGTIVGNTILDPQNATGRAIAVGNQGPGLVMDNVIRSAANATAPAIWWNGFTESDVTTVGNTFTVANPISNNGRALSIDNQIVPRGSINPTPPNLPGTLPNLNRQIFEVAPGAGVDAIQQTINSAAAKNGSRPVVHIPYGFYLITKTLQVPASDVQIIGDGVSDLAGTRLLWTGTGNGPVIQLNGPSHATLRDLSVSGGVTADGIVVANVDQVGARVYGDQAQFFSAKQASLLANGLDNAYVQLENIQFGRAAIVAIGGPGAMAGNNTPGKVNIFSAGSGNNAVSYDVSEGAKLLVRDLWYESGIGPGFAYLHDAGQFTLDAGRVSSPIGTPPAFNISGFNGNVSILSSDVDDRITISGDGSKTAVLGLGVYDHNLSSAYFTNSAAPAADAWLLTSRMASPNPAVSGSVPTPNIGAPDPAFIRKMLAQTRGERPQPPNALPAGVTDVRFFRVRVTNGINSLVLQPSGFRSRTRPRPDQP